MRSEPLITNDAIVFGILLILLALIFFTSNSKNPSRQKFYKYIPMLLLCYFLPSIFTTLGIIAPKWYDAQGVIDYLISQGYDLSPDAKWKEALAIIKSEDISKNALAPYYHESKLYFVASRYLLPASLVLLTLSISLREVFRLGPKALIMFFTGTIGIVIGGPLAIMLTSIVSPETVGGAGPEAIWRGMTTVAGSWIGGGANQAAMYEIFQPTDRLYSIMITVDVLVAEVWMAFLLFGVGKSKEIDKYFKADASAVEHLKNKMHDFSQKIARIATTTDLFVILGIGFGITGLAHLLSDFIAPWGGIIVSFTKLRNYEGAGASKVGSVFIYILVATIGMKMNVLEIFDNPGLFLVGGIWMIIHVGLMFIMAKIIRAPYFFLAVGSKANIGGAASAPVVAAAFHPSLAPVGVLLAVLGYALGTYGAWLCGILMQTVAP
jgi:uncharacterized membrane protein